MSSHFIIYSSLDRHLGWFHSLAIVDIASMSMVVQCTCGKLLSSLGICPGLVFFLCFFFFFLSDKPLLSVRVADIPGKEQNQTFIQL